MSDAFDHYSRRGVVRTPFAPPRCSCRVDEHLFDRVSFDECTTSFTQDRQDCIDIARGLVDRSLLQKVGNADYRIHDLLLDFVGHHIKPHVRKRVASRQAQYIVKFSVVKRYALAGGERGYYSLMALWRPLEQLEPGLQVEAYKETLPKGGDESEDDAFFYWAVARLLELQVGPESFFFMHRHSVLWRDVGFWIFEASMGTQRQHSRVFLPFAT